MEIEETYGSALSSDKRTSKIPSKTVNLIRRRPQIWKPYIWSCIFQFKGYASYSETIIETWYTSRIFRNISFIWKKVPFYISINFAAIYGFNTL